MKNTSSKIVRIGVGVLVIALTSGFLFPKKYKQPEPGVAAATLVITKSKSEIERPSPLEPIRYFSAYDNPTCSTKNRGGFLGTLMAPSGDMLSKLIGVKNESSKEFRIAAGQSFYLKTSANVVLSSSRYDYKARRCTNFVSFSPLEGHRYEASQISTDERCLLLVVDSDSRRVPDDFKAVPITGACQKN